MGVGISEYPSLPRRTFPLPIVPRTLSIFRFLLFLLGSPAGASAKCCAWKHLYDNIFKIIIS